MTPGMVLDYLFVGTGYTIKPLIAKCKASVPLLGTITISTNLSGYKGFVLSTTEDVFWCCSKLFSGGKYLINLKMFKLRKNWDLVGFVTSPHITPYFTNLSPISRPCRLQFSPYLT